MQAIVERARLRIEIATIGRAVAAACLLGALGVASAVSGQPHELTEGGYTVRSSVVDSSSLAPAAAREHGIEPSGGVGVLDVSVYRSDSTNYEALPATVQASLTGPAGVVEQIEMKPARAAGYVSYFGTFRYAPNEPLDFKISVKPEGAGQDLTLRYQETLRHQ